MSENIIKDMMQEMQGAEQMGGLGMGMGMGAGQGARSGGKVEGGQQADGGGKRKRERKR